MLIVRGLHREWLRSQFIDGAETKAISLAESAIDGPGFGYAHLGPAYKERCIKGISIAVADEAP